MKIPQPLEALDLVSDYLHGEAFPPKKISPEFPMLQLGSIASYPMQDERSLAPSLLHLLK